MRKRHFVISYDIADERRLARVAKLMERSAFRIQYSVFVLFDAKKSDIKALIENLKSLIDEETDDVRIYPMRSFGTVLGCGVDLEEKGLIIS